MALKALTPDAVTGFSLEDVFTRGDADKLAWVNGWRKLPHVPREVAKLYEYPQRFAEDVFDRIERTLHKRVAAGDVAEAARNGRLFILPVGEADAQAAAIPALPVEYILSSDRQLVAAHEATACGETELLHSRLEGELVVSYQTPNGWAGISKDILTEVLGAGRDVRTIGLPREAARVLRLMCRGLLPEDVCNGS
jgi:hypothetical protein